jgi:hypothetical protein
LLACAYLLALVAARRPVPVVASGSVVR